ncbi:MAG: hypothetical protein JW841_10640 [Deltaproteobacteria bacterium]|nr:hypothetical protein [Deltaproteobacteria bacterium]
MSLTKSSAILTKGAKLKANDEVRALKQRNEFRQAALLPRISSAEQGLVELWDLLDMLSIFAAKQQPNHNIIKDFKRPL